MTSEITLYPIATIRSERTEPVDDKWNSVRSRIELDADQFTTDALKGLDSFSHIEVIFFFHRVEPDRIERGARRPRDRSDWPEMGIFAQRGKNRPNRVGATVCEIVTVKGLTIHTAGLDAIDGSPVLDIKPVMQEFLPRSAIRQPPWVGEVMAEYW